MKVRAVVFGVLSVIAIWLQAADSRASDTQTNEAHQQKLSGPYQFKNLALFLVHGPNSADTGDIITLEEALKKKMIKVYETGSVNELEVQNLSKDKTIFIQAGDIVKGGRQDRTLSSDLLVRPGQQQVKVEAFCVEHSRWSRRAGESDREFEGSPNMIASKKMKVAATFAKEQTGVWSEVEKVQQKLGTNLGKSVSSPRSASSLQLSLEDADVKKRSSDYQSVFHDLVATNSDAIGYVFSINGDLSSADVYASHDLFSSLWPKLLEAAATEALSEQQPGNTLSKAVDASEAELFLDNAEHGRLRSAESQGAAKIRETEKSYFAETKRAQTDKNWIHRTYVTK